VSGKNGKPACEICGEFDHHCIVCAEICEGCVANLSNPQNCLLCRNLGYIGDPRFGSVAVCSNCGKGARLKLWIVHEKREGRYMPRGIVA
jgi:hypothetical protein